MRDRTTARAQLRVKPASVVLRAAVAGLVLSPLTTCAKFGFESEQQTQSTEERCAQNLSQRSYQHLDLSRCDLSGGNFDNADFTGADLRWARMDHAQFRHATLTDARLADVHAVGVDFTGADLTGSNMENFGSSGSTFSQAIMVKANLDSAGFRGTTLKGVDFSGSSLRNATFVDSTIWGSTFDHADLTGTRFQTNLDGSFLHTTCPDGEVSPASSPDFCIQHQIRGTNRRKPKKSSRQR